MPAAPGLILEQSKLQLALQPSNYLSHLASLLLSHFACQVFATQTEHHILEGRER